MLNAIRICTRKCLPFPSQCKTSSSICILLKIKLVKPRYSIIATTMSTAPVHVLKGRADRFNGMTIDSTKEDISGKEAFAQVLEDSIKKWTDENRRGIWFKVNITHSDWIPILVRNGFVYHHAQREYLMLFKWLPTNEESNIPLYAHTLAGVGAVVVNDTDQVLVVCEKYYDRPHWKLPGGYVEPGENFVDAAIREVYEETNIHTEFRSVLAFRHGHGGQFDCSDLYTVVSLKPLSEDLVKCEREIQDCKWMPIEEYLRHPDIHELNRFFVQKYLDNGKNKMKIECNHGIHQVLKKPYTVYHAVRDEDKGDNSCNANSNT